MKKLYIADVTITATTKTKIDLASMTVKQREKYAKKREVGNDGKSKIYTYSFTVEKQPIILIGGREFPDSITKNKFIMKHFHKIGVGKFEDYDYKVDFGNVKFSSNLMYSD